MPRPAVSVAARGAAFFAIYVGSAALLQESGLLRQAVLWLPTGVAVAGLWLLGRRYWPVIAIGTLVHRLLLGVGLSHALPAVLGNTLEALVAASLLHSFGFRGDIRRLRDALALVAVAAIAPIISASVGRAHVLLHPHHTSYFAPWAGWWRMNALGVLVVTPLILSWAAFHRTRLRAATAVEITTLGLTIFGLVWFLVFLEQGRGDSAVLLTYLALPVALYGAMRFGVRGGSTVTAIVTVLITLATTRGLGPFVEPAGGGSAAHVHETMLQGMVVLLAFTPLLFGAMVAERETALATTALERGRREELLASINRNVNDGLFRILPGQGLAYANTGLARLLGCDSPDQLLGRSLGEWVADPARARELDRRLAAGGPVLNEEVELRRCDGILATALVSSTGVHDAEGLLLYCDGAVVDISVRKRLEDRLQAGQKMEAIGQLAGGVAHDFNNLLTAILGYCDLALARTPPGDELHGDLEQIRRAGERAGSLTRQLLAFSRRQVLNPRVLALNACIGDMEPMLRRLIGEHIELTTRLAPDLGAVCADPGQIEQVLMNLVVNARDAMPGGGLLEIETANVTLDESSALLSPDARPGEYVRVMVRDDGAGMDENTRRRMFEPFFTTKRPGHGTGLGLATVYGIVRQSDGHIGVQSEPGRGTTMIVDLPRVSGPSETSSPAPGVIAGLPSLTALLVEDEEDVRVMVRRMLEQWGLRVLEAGGEAEALAAARAHGGRIDILLTDVVLRDGTGPDIAAILRDGRPEISVVFMSGHADPRVLERGASGAPAGFLAKPFTARALHETLQAALLPARPA